MVSYWFLHITNNSQMWMPGASWSSLIPSAEGCSQSQSKKWLLHQHGDSGDEDGRWDDLLSSICSILAHLNSTFNLLDSHTSHPPAPSHQILGPKLCGEPVALRPLVIHSMCGAIPLELLRTSRCFFTGAPPELDHKTGYVLLGLRMISYVLVPPW